MRAMMRRGIAVCAAVPLMFMLAVPSAFAEDRDPGPDPGTAEEASGSTLTDRLVEAAAAGVTSPDQIAEDLSLPSDGGGSLLFDEAGQVSATLFFSGAPGEELLAQIATLAVIEDRVAIGASIRVSPGNIEALRALPGVMSVTPSLMPLTGADRAGLLNSLQGALPATPGIPVKAEPVAADTCGPIPIEADAPLKSDLARDTYGVDGTGVTIGIISDSFGKKTAPTSWADDVASGALPGEANPCGYATPVEVLSDRLDASDEGRAMAQLVHGIAPGARILFADAGGSELQGAGSIEALAAAGADIIVDDITWLHEAYYQKSFIAASVDYVKAEYGVAYFASAGNGNSIAGTGSTEGSPQSSWQTNAYRPMQCPAWVEAPAGADCLNFSPDPGTQTAYDTLQIVPSSGGSGQGTMGALASIAEPMFGVTTEYELQFYRETGTEIEQFDSIGAIGFPYPGAFGTVDVLAGDTVRMVMVRTEFDPAATNPAVFIGFNTGAALIQQRQFAVNATAAGGVQDWVGEMVFGHAGDGSALGVASLHWDEPGLVRNYSSLGPNTTLFDAVDYPLDAETVDPPAPKPRKPAPVITASPSIAAVDGTQTTFFGEEETSPGGTTHRFFGTSAAAPNAAAVAVLAKQYSPGLNGQQLSDAIVATARGTAEGGPVNPYTNVPDEHVFGAGIVDAMALLGSLPVPAPSELIALPDGSDAVKVTWEQSGAPHHHLLEVFAGPTASGAPIASQEVAARIDSARFNGLEPNTIYTVRATAYSEAGAGGSLEAMTITAPLAPTGLKLMTATSNQLTLSWAAGGTLDSYRISLQGSGSGSARAADSAADTTTVDLPADATSYGFANLAADREYTVVLEAVNSNGVGSGATLTTRTLAAGTTPVVPVKPAAQGRNGGLAQTGGQSNLPLILGAAAILILGGVIVTVAMVRARARRLAADDGGVVAADAAGERNDQE